MIDFLFLVGVLLLPVMGLMWATFPEIEISWQGIKILSEVTIVRNAGTLGGLLLYFAIYVIAISLLDGVLSYFTFGEFQLPAWGFYAVAFCFYGLVIWKFSEIIEFT